MSNELLNHVARAIVIAKGAEVVASDEHWPDTVRDYHKMCDAHPDWADWNSLVNDAFREARAAIKAYGEFQQRRVRPPMSSWYESAEG